MNRIDKKFKDLKSEKKKAFIAYICAGDPNINITGQLALKLDKAGVDILELGVPFSDPLADGPTIQRASQRALKNRINLAKIFSLIKSLRNKTALPLVLMTYYNLIYHYGVKRFVEEAKSCGADGVIVPDLCPEAAGELINASKKNEFSTIFLASPTSTKKRITLIARKSTGFIYYVSLTGVTGARKALPPYIREHIKQIKKITKKPVCVGFGVSTRKQVKDLSKFCDGVIVGSAIINKLEGCLPHKNIIVDKVTAFAEGLLRGVR